MKLKHTQGKWEYDYNLDCRDIRTNKNDFIAGLEFMNSDDETNANGLLIATAPEMLEALIQYHKISYHTCYEHCGLQTLTARCDKCKLGEHRVKTQELIEKATGLKIEEVLEG